MPVAVVDANVLIAFTNADDQHHETGADIVAGIDRGVLPTAEMTTYVVAETLDFVNERRRLGVAEHLLDRLDQASGFRVAHATPADFDRAADVFRTYDGLSFSDATTVAYMRRTGVRYLYSFDDDFDAVDGLVRLDARIDPFRPS